MNQSALLQKRWKCRVFKVLKRCSQIVPVRIFFSNCAVFQMCWQKCPVILSTAGLSVAILCCFQIVSASCHFFIWLVLSFKLVFTLFVVFHRRREQHLAKEHQNEVDSLTADHLRETQKLLAEFNKAKELLKDKVDALQLMWVKMNVLSSSHPSLRTKKDNFRCLLLGWIIDNLSNVERSSVVSSF